MWSANRDVVAELLQEHQEGYPSIAPNSHLAKNLKNFTAEAYREISDGKELPSCLSSMSLQEIARFSYHLILYRAALSHIHDSQAVFDNDYSSFLKENNAYTRGLNDANPFIYPLHFKMRTMANAEFENCQ